MTLTGKIALVSGATRGIGQAIAFELGRQGATVIGTATSQQGAERISAVFKEQQITGQGMVLDVTQLDKIEQFFQEMTAIVGVPAILVNNAAITQDNLLLRMKDEEWTKVIDTNLTSIYRLTKVCVKAMLKARWGRIINITSIVGVTGNPGQCNYSASKAGVIGFTKSLALEIASRNVTVNAVAPGFIDTDMTRAMTDAQRESLLTSIPMARLGQPQDIANTVAFLASEKADYITGQTLHVNGGMYS